MATLPACRTWYKPGAGGEQLAGDRLRCEREVGTRDATALSACLQRAGWRQGGAASSTTDRRPGDTATSSEPAGPVPEQAAGAWFKFGTDGGQMAADLRLCEAAEETPVNACMHAKGWHAIGTRVTEKN